MCPRIYAPPPPQAAVTRPPAYELHLLNATRILVSTAIAYFKAPFLFRF